MAFFGNNCKNMINLSSISPKEGYISSRKHLFPHLYRIFAGYSPIKSGTFSRLDCLEAVFNFLEKIYYGFKKQHFGFFKALLDLFFHQIAGK